MLTRTLKEGQAEAASKDDFNAKDYTWFKYTSDRGLKLNGAKGSASIRKGDLFGVKEYTTKEDKILVLNSPTLVFRLAVPKSEKLMDEKAKESKGKKPVLPTAAPASKKVKIDLDKEPTAKAPKEKIVKVKLTANQKAIAALKTEIKRIKSLKPNAANLRKIATLKDDLKKKQAKEKVAAVPKAGKVSKPATDRYAIEVKVEPITKRIIGSIGGVEMIVAKLTKGGYSVDYSKVGGKNVKTVGNASKVKTVITNRLNSWSTKNTPDSTVQSPVRVKESAAPVNPVKEAKKIVAKKVKITVAPHDDDDEDDDIPPRGGVRYGGSLIEPDELEFDDDTSNLGIDMPIDESWSADTTLEQRMQKIRKSKRPE